MSQVTNTNLPNLGADDKQSIQHKETAAAPPGRWLGRQFIDNHIHSIEQAAKFPAEVSEERCAELATTPSLRLSAFIELVGVGIGMHESYQVSSEGVAFRKWEEEYISQAPIDWQAEMNRDNEESPKLTFPCPPAELLQFIDTAIGIHCFSVPDAFRQAMTNKISEEPDSAKSSTTKATPADWIEQVREIALAYIAKHKASDLFPSQMDVCRDAEEEARKRKIYGSHGKPISARYIQRNAIQGDWWKKNKP